MNYKLFDGCLKCSHEEEEVVGGGFVWVSYKKETFDGHLIFDTKGLSGLLALTLITTILNG